MTRHRITAVVMTAVLATGCSEIAAVATAPVTATVMTVGAWVNDGPSDTEIQQSSDWLADTALVQALEQGHEGSTATWSNPSDPGGPVGGRATLLTRSRGSDGATCWRVLVEQRVGSSQVERSRRTLCPVGHNGWTDAGE